MMKYDALKAKLGGGGPPMTPMPNGPSDAAGPPGSDMTAPPPALNADPADVKVITDAAANDPVIAAIARVLGMDVAPSGGAGPTPPGGATPPPGGPLQ